MQNLNPKPHYTSTSPSQRWRTYVETLAMEKGGDGKETGNARGGVVLSTMLRPGTQEAPMGIDALSTLGETCIILDITVDMPMEVMLDGGSARHTLDIGSLDPVSFTMVEKEAIVPLL
jgi:hypothetical protein